MEDGKQAINEGSNDASPDLDVNGTILMNNEDFSQWSVDDVITWCISTLEVEETDPLCQRLRENDIEEIFCRNCACKIARTCVTVI